MAKRKRLEMPEGAFSPDLETKSVFPAPRARMPIAEVAGDTANRAALEEVAREMTAAEGEGRVIHKLPLDQIRTHHLCRDRMVLDETEMDALRASVEARGQQTPIEVVRLPDGKYGLISGLRRIEALQSLGHKEVLALVRHPEDSQAAYQAMVEENEIRAGVSFYERANIAVAAVGQGIYSDSHAAVNGLFSHAAKSKRSKIRKFVTIRETIGNSLAFPTAIPEHLGVQLGQAIEADHGLAGRVSQALKDGNPGDAATERRIIESVLKSPRNEPPRREEVVPGLKLELRKGRAVLSGKAVDDAFVEALRSWAVSHAKP